MSGSIATDGFLQLRFVEIVDDKPIPTRNRFRDADNFINRKRNQISVISIKIIEKLTSVEIETCGTPAMTIFKYFDEQGFSRRFQSRDFIVNRSDYKFNDVLKQPEQRDIIVELQDDVRYTYEVLAVNMEPAFRDSGAYRFAYRIHTKLVKQENI